MQDTRGEGNSRVYIEEGSATPYIKKMLDILLISCYYLRSFARTTNPNDPSTRFPALAGSPLLGVIPSERSESRDDWLWEARRGMGNGVRVRTITCAALLLCAVQVQLALAESPAAQTVRDPQVSDIFVSSDLGYVVEKHEPPSPESAPVIVHIQEAHTNYEAQKHLAGMLEELITRYGLRLILVEGGQGDVSLAHLRAYGPPDNRLQVAEKYLKAGIISGEEYLDIVSDHPLTLWGIERKDLYEHNLQTFIEVESLQESFRPVLALVRQAAEALRPVLFSQELKDLDAKAAAFGGEKLSLADYIEALVPPARLEGIRVDDEYPNLARFRSARQLERDINLGQVQQEQQALVKELRRSAEPKRLEALIAQAGALKEGRVTREVFYSDLQKLAVASGASLEQSPALSRYIRYLKQSAGIQPTVLADELDRLAARLRERLAASPESRQLVTLFRQLDLIEKLLELRLSPPEYQQLHAWTLDEVLASWKSFLTAQAASHSLPNRSFDPLDAFTGRLSSVQRFYELAQQRDRALVDNALAKLKETKAPIAVLITGGFHSAQITQLLQDQGVGVVVLAPKVTQATNERLYRAVLKYKSGHGTFDDVMAIANQTAAAAVSN